MLPLSHFGKLFWLLSTEFSFIYLFLCQPLEINQLKGGLGMCWLCSAVHRLFMQGIFQKAWGVWRGTNAVCILFFFSQTSHTRLQDDREMSQLSLTAEIMNNYLSLFWSAWLWFLTFKKINKSSRSNADVICVCHFPWCGGKKTTEWCCVFQSFNNYLVIMPKL